MDMRGKRQAASIFGGMGFYIALLVCVVAAGVVGYFALLNDGETSETENPPMQSVDSIEDDSSITPVGETDAGDAHEVISQTPVVIPQPVEKPDIPEETVISTGGDDTKDDVPVSGGATVPDQPTQEQEQLLHLLDTCCVETRHISV